jgi:hypothetical protein
MLEADFFWFHVITQNICNKFIAVNFSVGCMVWPWYCLFLPGLPVKLLTRCRIVTNKRVFYFSSWLAIPPCQIFVLNFLHESTYSIGQHIRSLFKIDTIIEKETGFQSIFVSVFKWQQKWDTFWYYLSSASVWLCAKSPILSSLWPMVFI